MTDALLQEVAAPLAALGQQVEGVFHVGVLRQHHDPELGMGTPQGARGSDAFVGKVRWHAHVGEHHVGIDRFDQREQVVVGRGDPREGDVVEALQERGDAGAKEVAVLGEDDAKWSGHGQRLPLARYALW